MVHWSFLAAAAASTLAIYRWRHADPAPHRVLHATAGAVVLASLCAWALMRVGMFSVPALAAVAVAAAAYTWRLPAGAAPGRSTWGVATAITLLALFALYESYPTWYLLGGRDPGVYAAQAAHVARTGGMHMDLPAVALMWEQSGGATEPGYPGFYSAVDRGLSTDRAALVPQFAHLFPALGAVGWSAFGAGGFVRTNAVVLVLALASLHAVTRRVFAPGPALAVTALLGLNPAVIWSARHVMTEPLSMLFGFFGLHLLLCGDEREHRGFAAAGGALLGLAVLDRLDASLNVLLVVGYAAAALDSAAARRRAGVAAIAYGLGATLGFADAWVHSRPYVTDLMGDGSVTKLMITAGLGTAASLAVVALPDRFGATAIRAARALAVLAVLGLGGWLAWDWTVRSHDVTSFPARSIRELAWYTTPLVLALGPVGMLAAAVQPGRRTWWPLVALGGLTLFAYTLDPSISPDHPWASRRWVPHVIPLLVVFAAAAVVEVATRTPRLRPAAWGAAALAATVYLANAEVRTRPFLFHSMYAGLDEDLHALATQARAMRRHRIVLTDDGELASTLTWIYALPTVVLPRPLTAEVAARLEDHLLITRRTDERWAAPAATVQVGGRYIDRTTGHPTDRSAVRVRTYLLADITPLGAPAPARRFVAGDLATLVGARTPDGYATTGTAGFLAFGPYIQLEPAMYLATWDLAVRQPGSVRLDVWREGTTLAAHQATPGVESSRYLHSEVFRIDAPIDRVELRTWVDGSVDATLLSVTLRQLTIEGDR